MEGDYHRRTIFGFPEKPFNEEFSKEPFSSVEATHTECVLALKNVRHMQWNGENERLNPALTLT